MQYFEIVYREMERLLILELSEVVRKLNEEKNDGLIIQPFSNKTLQDKNLSVPYFTFALSNAEKTSRDILIENVVFKCEIEIHLNEIEKNYLLKLWRYFTAVERMLDENGVSGIWQNIRVSETKENKIILKITV